MNKLTQLRSAYETGSLRKQEYIEAAHASHTALFAYPEFLSGTDVESLRITPEGVFVRSRSQQVELFVDPLDQHLVPCTLMNFRAYETAETEFLKSLIKAEGTILDIGANCGWYALALAKHCASAQVHAFEPIPHTHEMLLRNVQHNGLTNIEVHRLAFSDREGELRFLHTPSCSGATSLAVAGQPVAPDDLEEVVCPGTTLDLFCERHRLAPQIIKCDVEGAELMVMQGAQATIAAHKPAILIELLRKWARQFDYHPNDVVRLLGEQGYRAYTLDEQGLAECPEINEATVETNFIFLHDQQHRDVLAASSLQRAVP